MKAFSGVSAIMPLLIGRIKEMIKEKGIKKMGEQFFTIIFKHRTQTKTINAWYECCLMVESVYRGISIEMIMLLDSISPRRIFDLRWNDPPRRTYGGVGFGTDCTADLRHPENAEN